MWLVSREINEYYEYLFTNIRIYFHTGNKKLGRIKFEYTYYSQFEPVASLLFKQRKIPESLIFTMGDDTSAFTNIINFLNSLLENGTQMFVKDIFAKYGLLTRQTIYLQNI